ncbi:hypothetical protein [Pistricoccus aurantiacus]|uniref:hypothetical protein n=1 Tax=Pistricoccus aurantiacus TaxID=1883414 RepID=UPI003628AA47
MTPSTDILRFRHICLRALLYILLIGALMQGVYLEALYLPERRFSETGFTELAQSGVLLASAMLALYLWRQRPEMPVVCCLFFAFLGASLIREQDAWLDQYVAENTWKVLVALLILPCLFYVIRRRHVFITEFEGYANSFSFGLFAAGFLTTYVFSRLYGRGEMWEAVLGDAYRRVFKDAAEEVTELLGYTLMLVAMIELFLLIRRRLKRS